MWVRRAIFLDSNRELAIMSDASVGCTVRLFPRLIIRSQASSRGKGLLWEKTVRNN
jgi:hypothetical protein